MLLFYIDDRDHYCEQHFRSDYVDGVFCHSVLGSTSCQPGEMSVLIVAIPIALILGGAAVIAFVVQVRSGQYDDLETPPRRILFDDVEADES